MAARSRTGHALPLRLPRRWLLKLAPTAPAFAFRRLAIQAGSTKGPEAPAELYRYLVGELNKLNLAYLHILHTGNEALVSRIAGKAWKQPLLVNRPGAARDDALDLVT